MDLFNYWMYGVVAFAVLFALRVSPHEDPRLILRAIVIWPISVVVVGLVLAFSAVGWEFDATRNTKMFGFRRPNDGWPGFAITVFYAEIQMWKIRKA